MSNTELLELMRTFRVAYGRADAAALSEVTSADFEWHQHCSETADNQAEQHTGRVLKGIGELLAELAWRQEHWSNVSYENLEERAASDLLVQTFVIRGEEDGRPFHAKVVDLYPVANGRITRKDTYWKYQR